MIKNEKQYRITKAWIHKFEDLLFELNRLPDSKEQPWLRQGQKESIEMQLEDLRTQVNEYEMLKSGKANLPPLDIINNVPELLIKWRIARNWTQKDLAETLGLAEQQVQKYERTDYATATLETLFKVAAVLREGPAGNRKTQLT